MNSSIPLLPDVQSIVIHLNSFSVWFLLTVSTASTLSSNSPHPCADYCTHLLNSLSAFNLSHNPLFGFLDPNHPELLLGRWWVHLMEWWTYSAKRWGERKGRVCIWGDQGAGKQESWREKRLYYRRNPQVGVGGPWRWSSHMGRRKQEPLRRSQAGKCPSWYTSNGLGRMLCQNYPVHFSASRHFTEQWALNIFWMEAPLPTLDGC